MSDTPENIFGNVPFGEKNTANIACRVAYTLNNTQPVLCTIIGEQPLFYMDFESEEEYIDEDSFLHGEDIEILEQEIQQLKHEISKLERTTDINVKDEQEKITDFFENTLSVTEQTSENYSKTQTKLSDRREKILSALSKSRLAQAYLDHMYEHNVDIVLDHGAKDAHYDRTSGKIILNANLDDAEITLLCARELRRHWQHRQGALLHPLMLDPDTAILVNRIQICDTLVSMIRIAWEIQLSGDKHYWSRIESSPMADLARSFAREAFLDFRTINNGTACAAIFETWFLSERCQEADKILIQQMLSDYQGYVFDGAKPIESFNAKIIAALGTMPYGKNYLAEHAGTILNDPIFTDVRDRSNANFLWFIKFERSFRETEQGLQKGVDNSDHDVRHDLYSKNIKGSHDAKENAAQIISLYTQSSEDGQTNAMPEESNDTKRLKKQRQKAHTASGEAKKRKNGESADVIFLQRWSAE